MNETAEEAIRQEEISKQREKFYDDYEKWRAANPKLVEEAKIVSKLPDFRKDIDPEPAKEIFLYFLYGMELSRLAVKAASGVELPGINYDPDEPMAAYLDGEAILGRHHPYEAANHLSKEFSHRDIPESIIVGIIRSGAHEFGHAVFEQKAHDEEKASFAYEHRIFMNLADNMKLGVEIRKVSDWWKDQMKQFNDPDAIYDASPEELMTLNWELMVLKKFMPWQDEEIKDLKERRSDAEKIRRHISEKRKDKTRDNLS